MTVEDRMKQLALMKFGTEDLSSLPGGTLELLEKEVDSGDSMGDS